MKTDSHGASKKQSLTGLRALWCLYVAFIVYGTLIPFSYCDFEGCIAQNVTAISWRPFVDPDGSRASISDVVQNVLFFMPFGFLSVLASGRRNVVAIIGVGLCAALLSASVECSQLLTTDRTPSVTDVVTNSVGALLGALIAASCRRLLDGVLASRRYQALQQDRLFFLVLTAGGVIAVGSLQPFDFTLDVKALWSVVKSFLRNPLSTNSVLKDELVVGLRFFIFSAMLVYWLRATGQTGFLFKGFAYSSLTGLFFEVCQLIIPSRVPTLQDASVIVLTSFLGAVFMARSRRASTLNSFPPQWGLGIIFLTCVGAVVQTFSPFQIAYEYRSLNWVPFLTYYERTSFVDLSDFIESILIYFPMAFVLQALTDKRRISLAVCFFCLTIASSLEFLQGWVEGRVPDITDIIGGFAGIVAACWLCVVYKRTYLVPVPERAPGSGAGTHRH